MALSTGSLASWSDIELLFKRVSAETTRWTGSEAISPSSYGGQGQTIKASTPNSLKNLVQALGNVSYISSKVTTSSISDVSVGEQIKPTELNSLNDILFNVKNTSGVCGPFCNFGFNNSFATSSCSSFNASFTFFQAGNTTFYSFEFTASSNTNTVVRRSMSSNAGFFTAFNNTFNFFRDHCTGFNSFGFNTFFTCTSGFFTSFNSFRPCGGFTFCFRCTTYFGSFGFNGTFYSFSFNASFGFFSSGFFGTFNSAVNGTFSFKTGFNTSHQPEGFAVFFSGTFNSFFVCKSGFFTSFNSAVNSSFNASFEFKSNFNSGFTFDASNFNSSFFFFTAGFCNNFQHYFS